MAEQEHPDPSAGVDIGRALAQALETERGRRSRDVGEQLDEIRLLRSWLELDLPAEVRGQLLADMTEARVQLAELLLGWQDVGGVVSLAMESAILVEVAAEDEIEESAPPLAPPTVRMGEPASTPPTQRPPTDAEAAQPAPRQDEPAAAEAAPTPEPASDEAASDDIAPVPDAPPPQPASPAHLSALQEHFQAGPLLPDLPHEGWHSALAAILAGLVPSSDALEEERRVCRGANDTGRWTTLPKGVQRQLVGLLTSRLRSLQDEQGRAGPTINAAFSALTRYSSLEQPGFVFGLARHHSPQRGSWSEDADSYWEELSDLLPAEDDDAASVGELLRDVEQLVPEIELAPEDAREVVRRQVVRKIRAALEGGVRARNTRLVRLATPLLDHLEGREFRTLRRAIRERESQAADEDDTDDSSIGLPEDWPWWPCTRGRRALMVGGDPREPNRARLQEVFAFDSLEWSATTGKPQSLQSAAHRIRQGSVDLLIVLTRFVGHNYDDILLPACKDAGVDWVSVDHGYGSGRIRLAIERFLDAE